MNDQTAAADLEITSELAEASEDILREFAENAELDVALIIDHSGALIAGIAAAEEVHVETVGALAAGTIGSIRALGKAVGETQSLESTHHGNEYTVYLRELSDRFIIVGVAEADLPAGIIREVAAQVATPLLDLLTKSGIGEKENPSAAIEEEEEEVKVPEEPPFELSETDSKEDSDTATSEVAIDSPPPVVEQEIPLISTPLISSPFEFVDDDDEVEEEDEIQTEESGDLEDRPEFIEAKSQPEGKVNAGGVAFEFDDGDENDEAESGESVAAPFLLSPIMPAVPSSAEEDIRDEEADGVAAISVPIATDISEVSDRAEIEFSDSTLSEEPEEENEEPEEEKEPEEPKTGGPRYVFDIG